MVNSAFIGLHVPMLINTRLAPRFSTTLFANAKPDITEFRYRGRVKRSFVPKVSVSLLFLYQYITFNVVSRRKANPRTNQCFRKKKLLSFRKWFLHIVLQGISWFNDFRSRADNNRRTNAPRGSIRPSNLHGPNLFCVETIQPSSILKTSTLRKCESRTTDVILKRYWWVCR